MQPNQSKKIMNAATSDRSKILHRQKPLNVETKPVAGLTGILWNEMVEINNQTANRKSKST